MYGAIVFSETFVLSIIYCWIFLFLLISGSFGLILYCAVANFSLSLRKLFEVFDKDIMLFTKIFGIILEFCGIISDNNFANFAFALDKFFMYWFLLLK